MVKKFFCLLLLIFFITSINGCSLQSDTHAFGVRIYLSSDQKNVFVIDQSKPTGIGHLFQLNIQTMKLSPLLTSWKGEFYDNDPFSRFVVSNDLILSFKQINQKFYGIWRFDLVKNTAVCLINDIEKNCYLLEDDRENNLIFFEQRLEQKSTDLYAIDRSGKNKKLLEADFDVYPEELGKIDQNTYYFFGDSEQNGGKMLLFDIPKKETTLFSGTSYSAIGVFNQTLLAKISSNSVGDRFVQINGEGIISSIPEISTYISDFSILDQIRKNLIYTNELENKQFQIELVNLDSKKKDVLAVYQNDLYSESITHYEKENILSFYTEELTPSGSKLFFHKLDVATKKIDSIELNKNATYWHSQDYLYLLCNNIQEDEYQNAIIDTANNKLHLFNERVRIDELSICYVRSLEKYMFSAYNDAKQNLLCTVDKLGKVEIITKF